MQRPKILVGTPIFEFNRYCVDEYLNSIKNLTYQNYDILLVDNSKEEGFYKELIARGVPTIHMEWREKSRDRLCEGHNILRKKTLEDNYEYLFLVDADVIPPKDVIERLLHHNKKVVTGIYFNPLTCPDGIKRNFPVIRLPAQDKKQWIVPSFADCKGLMPIAGAGTGCLLIHRSVLEKHKFWYDPKAKGADDVFFFKSLYEDNIEMFADCSVICKHLIENKPYVWQKKDLKEGAY